MGYEPSTAPPRGRELNAPKASRPPPAGGSLAGGCAPSPPGCAPAPSRGPPCPLGTPAKPGLLPVTKKKEAAYSRFSSHQWPWHTHTLKKPYRAHPGPFWAPGRPPCRPRQWEGVTAPHGAWGRAPVPGQRPGCRGACAARPRGARCHPVNCVSRETLLQSWLQFDSVNLWCYTYTVIYTLYTRS